MTDSAQPSNSFGGPGMAAAAAEVASPPPPPRVRFRPYKHDGVQLFGVYGSPDVVVEGQTVEVSVDGKPSQMVTVGKRLNGPDEYNRVFHAKVEDPKLFGDPGYVRWRKIPQHCLDQAQGQEWCLVAEAGALTVGTPTIVTKKSEVEGAEHVTPEVRLEGATRDGWEAFIAPNRTAPPGVGGSPIRFVKLADRQWAVAGPPDRLAPGQRVTIPRRDAPDAQVLLGERLESDLADGHVLHAIQRQPRPQTAAGVETGPVRPVDEPTTGERVGGPPAPQ